MHEVGIANAILEAVSMEARRNGHGLPCRVGVRIGELAAVDPDALRFAFEALTRDTALARLTLVIEACPLRHRCCHCGEAFAVSDFLLECPRCGSTSTECIGGDELELSYWEVEDEARETGTESTQ